MSVQEAEELPERRRDLENTSGLGRFRGSEDDDGGFFLGGDRGGWGLIGREGLGG